VGRPHGLDGSFHVTRPVGDLLAEGTLVRVGDVERRRVLKFAYDEPLARPGRYAHFYDAPGCTEAASYHAEVAVPDELRARTTRLADNVTGTVLAEGPRDADRPHRPGRRGHP